jgi:hypothetical protein
VAGQREGRQEQQQEQQQEQRQGRADVAVELAANPSHLETVGPIVMGVAPSCVTLTPLVVAVSVAPPVRFRLAAV